MCPPCERYRHLPQHEEMYEIARDNLRMLRNTGEEVRLVALLTEPEDTKELWEENRLKLRRLIRWLIKSWIDIEKFVKVYVKHAREDGTAADVAAELDLKTQTVTRRANNLRKRGVELPELKRSTTLTMVEAAKAALAEAMADFLSSHNNYIHDHPYCR